MSDELEKLKNKYPGDSTDIEFAIVMLDITERNNKVPKASRFAASAAAELASIQARLTAAEALVTKWKAADPYEWTASDKKQCADELAAALGQVAK